MHHVLLIILNNINYFAWHKNYLQATYKEVLNKDHEVHLLMSKGADMQSKVTRKAEAVQLQNKMDTTKRQWEKIRKIANDR